MNKPITPKEMKDWVKETWDRCQKEAWSEPMNREDIDKLWQQALIESVKDGEQFARYHFAALVAAAEREACAQLCADDGMLWGARYAAKIRARGDTNGRG